MTIARIGIVLLVMAGMKARAYEWKDYRQSENVEIRSEAKSLNQKIIKLIFLPPKNGSPKESAPGQSLVASPQSDFIASMYALFLAFNRYASDPSLTKCVNFSVLKTRMGSLESGFREVVTVGSSMARFKPLLEKMIAFSLNLRSSISSTETRKCNEFKSATSQAVADAYKLGLEAFEREAILEQDLKHLSDHYQRQMTPMQPADVSR